MRRLSEITGSKVSMHAPIIDASGFTQQGWSEQNRVAAEKQFNSVLEKACRNGYLEMAKWAFNSEWGKLKKWFKCDSYTNCFSTACYNNHLEVAKWLMSTDIKDEINKVISDMAYFVYTKHESNRWARQIYDATIENII